jgi:hypothetical protein
LPGVHQDRDVENEVRHRDRQEECGHGHTFLGPTGPSGVKPKIPTSSGLPIRRKAGRDPVNRRSKLSGGFFFGVNLGLVFLLF